MKQAFLFDINKCVGCMACVTGCIIENGTSLNMNWREVHRANPWKHPDLPIFYFSLACNQCEEAPCMKNCPALAYSRDEATGAIVHHAEKCIGCTYCTWACPYDAPKFNPMTKVIEKCNFCVDRLHQAKQPACVVACPVNALSFGEMESGQENPVPGFVNRGIKPSIQLIPLRESHTKPVIWTYQKESDKESIPDPTLPLEAKISITKEWALIPFTLTMALLVGWLGASYSNDIPFSPPIFLGLGGLAMGLSALHLGKKLRAWRSVLNIKNSWLSREIVGVSTFLATGALYAFSNHWIIGILAMVAGVFMLISIDKVYSVTERKNQAKLHSSMVWITGLLFWSILSGNSFFIGLVIVLKTTLYLYRKVRFYQHKIPVHGLVSGLRLSLLWFPVLIGIFLVPIENYWFFAAFVMTGELIDRSEFYNEIEVISPKKELAKIG